MSLGDRLRTTAMDQFLKDNLETYLSGELHERQKAEWDAYLAAHPAAAQQVALHEETASMLRELRPPEDNWSGAPGFYDRLMDRIEEQRRIPFWSVFLQPPFGRRLAFASLMWLALLGSYFVTVTDPADSPRHVAESFLIEKPSSVFEVRLGADLNANRSSMLATLISPGE
jgi:anti-sigma factor RsiW